MLCIRFKNRVRRMGTTTSSKGAISGSLIFEDFIEHLGLYVSNNLANVKIEVVHRLGFLAQTSVINIPQKIFHLCEIGQRGDVNDSRYNLVAFFEICKHCLAFCESIYCEFAKHIAHKSSVIHQMNCYQKNSVSIFKATPLKKTYFMYMKEHKHINYSHSTIF